MGAGTERLPGAPAKREEVAALVRGMIADGTLLPGAPAPSSAELARKTGYHVTTCRAALTALLADGVLVRGVSRTARLRVPADSTDRGVRVPLSAALGARRRAAGLTQPELAGQLGVSLTTVGHAETGRLWQRRRFWECADAVLGAAGTLVGLYDRHHAANGLTAEEPPEPPGAPEPSPAALWPVSINVTAAGVLVVWPDGTENLVPPPDG